MTTHGMFLTTAIWLYSLSSNSYRSLGLFAGLAWEGVLLWAQAAAKVETTGGIHIALPERSNSQHWLCYPPGFLQLF